MVDDLHILCPRHDSGPSENERKLTASLCAHLDSLHRSPPPAHLVVIATTNQVDRVEPSLRRPGHFDKEIDIPVPSAVDRREVCMLHMCAFVWNLKMLSYVKVNCLPTQSCCNVTQRGMIF